MIDKILDYLKEVESDHVHYNKGEDDITLPYGIYKQYHSKLYKYIVDLADENKITKPTSQWTQEEINHINKLIEKSAYGVRQLAKEFYREFIKDAHIELFTQECQVAMYSMYTNSPEGAWISVQNSIIQFFSTLQIPLSVLPKEELSEADGGYGELTRDALIYLVKTYGNELFFNISLEDKMISNMKTYYATLAVDDPETNLRNLNGWNNRVNKLHMMR